MSEIWTKISDFRHIMTKNVSEIPTVWKPDVHVFQTLAVFFESFKLNDRYNSEVDVEIQIEAKYPDWTKKMLILYHINLICVHPSQKFKGHFIRYVGPIWKRNWTQL